LLGTGLAIVAKQRMGDAEVDAFSVVGNVEGCDVIMIDDMTTTCGTLCAAAKILKEHGAATIRAAVTHAPLTDKGMERLAASTDLTELVVTDTILLREDLLSTKLPVQIKVLSVANVFGEAIRRIHNDESISSLFNH
jgi:ribose-phosphate pyrophosphokinase